MVKSLFSIIYFSSMESVVFLVPLLSSDFHTIGLSHVSKNEGFVQKILVPGFKRAEIIAGYRRSARLYFLERQKGAFNPP